MASRVLSLHSLLLLFVALALLSGNAYAFGAGSIPEYSFLHDRAFRHGDISHVLAALAKTPHRHTGGGGGLLDFFTALTAQGIGAVLQGRAAATFTKNDVQRVYFGNWLRDYSQAIDVAGLSKMAVDELLMIVQVLSFMSFGYATREYEVTPERLGVYLPVEHIDNPKGYAEKEGDARKFHPKLRPPVDPEELEIDPKTGMKKYMATEGQSWDTSTAHIRRTLTECIARGRRVHADGARAQEAGAGDPDDSEDMWEAFRLLGGALHTLEDLLAHSNWCEIALCKLGYAEVFCHVGDKVRVKTPTGPAPPLVTGSFGSADFMHSILGEASDHLSTASVVDLTQHMEEAGSTEAFSSLRGLFSGLPDLLNPAEKASSASSIEEKAKRYDAKLKRRGAIRRGARSEGAEDDGEGEGVHEDEGYGEYEELEETEMQAFLWEVLLWRDELVRGIAAFIDGIPGLADLLEKITSALNACVFTLLAPILIPLIGEITLALKEESQAVIDSEDQYEVFDNPKASDPTHSILAKDHVDLILNEPAGKISQIVVEHTVKLIVHAWYGREDDPDKVIDQVLEAFHHPYYATGASQVQNDMLQCMNDWLDDFGEDKAVIIDALTKQSVRDGTNKRIAGLGRDGDSVDTLSSLEGTDEEYGSAYDGSQRSDAASDHEHEQPPPRPASALGHYHSQGSYRDVLRDPRASSEAKREARARLVREDWDVGSQVASTTGANVDSDEAYDYGSDADSLSDSDLSGLGSGSGRASRASGRRRGRRRERHSGGAGIGQDDAKSSSDDDDAYEEAVESHEHDLRYGGGGNWNRW